MLDHTVVEKWERAHEESERLRRTAIEAIDAEIRELQKKRKALASGTTANGSEKKCGHCGAAGHNSRSCPEKKTKGND